MRRIKLALLLLAGILILIQLIPTSHDNPSYDKSSEISAPPEVMNILKTSCYDCHSYETVWPYYSYIAPVSWLVTNDVSEGRNELNFSEWNQYSAKKKSGKAEEIEEHVREGKMPMPIYLIMHSEAELSETQKAILFKWTEEFLSEHKNQ